MYSKTRLCVCIKGNSEHPEIVTVLERKVDILPTAQPAHSTATSADSSDTELGSSKPFTALKDRFLQVYSRVCKPLFGDVKCKCFFT